MKICLQGKVKHCDVVFSHEADGFKSVASAVSPNHELI